MIKSSRRRWRKRFTLNNRRRSWFKDLSSHKRKIAKMSNQTKTRRVPKTKRLLVVSSSWRLRIWTKTSKCQMIIERWKSWERGHMARLCKWLTFLRRSNSQSSDTKKSSQMIWEQRDWLENWAFWRVSNIRASTSCNAWLNRRIQPSLTRYT